MAGKKGRKHYSPEQAARIKELERQGLTHQEIGKKGKYERLLCYDNFIVAHDMAAVQDNALVYRTIKKAKKEAADGLILHSGQGFQYTLPGYWNLTKQYGILPSMSRAGTPLDKAPAENFFGTLKKECIYRHKIQTIEQARNLIDDYIYFYNFERFPLKSKRTPFQKRSRLG